MRNAGAMVLRNRRVRRRRSPNRPAARFAGMRRTVARLPAQLARATQRDVIAYDRLGFGRSDRHPGTLGTTFVRDEADHAFAALLEQLGVDAFVALGHSVGGGMAVGCAAAHPDRCRALVTIAAQAFVEDRTLAGIRDAGSSSTNRASSTGSRAITATRPNGCCARGSTRGCRRLSRLESRRRLAARAMRDARDSRRRRRIWVRRASEADRARVAGPSSYLLFGQCGHMPHRERTGDVLAAVTTFLRDALA